MYLGDGRLNGHAPGNDLYRSSRQPLDAFDIFRKGILTWNGMGHLLLQEQVDTLDARVAVHSPDHNILVKEVDHRH